jgi:putative transposase
MSLKSELVVVYARRMTDAKDARHLVKGYVEHYNNVRLNRAIGYIAPKDMLPGHQQEIRSERDRKLEAAREQRKNRR